MGSGFAVSESRISDCVAHGNSGSGIFTFFDDNVVLNNLCGSNAFSGIYVHSRRNLIDGNQCIRNGRGITCDDAVNTIIRNICHMNTTLNRSISASSARYGPIINIVSGSGPSVSGDGPAASSMTTADPYANFAR
ncbi:MAG: right-handed parallel beta-helix repeat-containing protein [Phycisphaeraceae bacterium]|nr:right-handed parallel beta-helix repeat-containing protein [Phycisphaeraceae bacterium]